MPLLKRKAFEKSTASGFLKDDDEVFHCEITDEIFKDYEEYCERIILVNSMVWSCEMTGKPNLTYAEALESEKNARRSLRDFPTELRIPILYLASRTKRCSFAEMLDDVFNYVRDRYFVGETVEACLEGDVWSEGHVLSIISPKQQPNNGANTLNTPSSVYFYEVEQYEENEASAQGQVGTVPCDRVRRKKGIFTRDKNKLFLKQFVEQGPGGVIRIKMAAITKYNIPKVNFDQIFTGNPPDFPSSKKFIKSSITTQQKGKSISIQKSSPLTNKNSKKPSPDKKGRQESISKYVTKTDKFEGTKQSKTMEINKGLEKPPLKDEMKRLGDQMKQKKLEEKQKKKEKSIKLAAFVKEWSKQKDDLELEDHKVLPQGLSIEIVGVPTKYFGDFLSVLEFVHLYAETLKVKDVFHNGVDIDTLRKALTIEENIGLFSELIQMFLTTIFSLQEDEAEEYNEGGSIQESNSNAEGNNNGIGMTMAKAIQLATYASKWPQTYLATPLSKLPLDAYTVTEVLRLHLLSSGAEAGERCARWRYQQRGGYSSMDDAGLRMRLCEPAVLKALATKHIGQLSLGEKFKILHCLMNQILSYATVRDIVEEKLENLRTVKYELRNAQVAERKREVEHASARQKLKKDAITKKEEEKLTGEKSKLVDEELQKALDKLAKENEIKKAEFEKKAKDLQAQCFDYLSYLGSDRAYRKYWLHQSVPGLFIEHNDFNTGTCFEKPVIPVPTLSEARPEDTLMYIQNLFATEQGGASDKENDSALNSRSNSPKKGTLNGLSQKLSIVDSNAQMMRELLMCTGNSAMCPVHGMNGGKPKWSVVFKADELNKLIDALNKRGYREADLKQNLEQEKSFIINYIEKCPVAALNSSLAPPQLPLPLRPKKFPQSSIQIPPDSNLHEALELSLRDYILELEEKVFHGCLGTLKVKDREAWRGTILLRSYDKQAQYLSWGPNKQYRDDQLPNGKIKVEQNGDIPKPVVNSYRDPGYFLAESAVYGLESESPLADVKVINGHVKQEVGGDREHRQVVAGLASALLQISQCINHKYLKRPLGYDEKERKEREGKSKPFEFDALERWEVSLMESSSFAQVALHLLTLDGSITWSRSILNANCRICRRRTDAQNMLLCDGCNKGHHLYCLKPKLTKVPEGDWFCDQCKPKEKSPRKRRKLFAEMEAEEQSENWDADTSATLEVCAWCGSGGELNAKCAACARLWHAECARPRPAAASARLAARTWRCRQCVATASSVRRDSDTSEEGTILPKANRRSRASKEASPAVNGLQNGHSTGKKRSRRSLEEPTESTGKKSRNSMNESVTEQSALRKKKRNSRVERLLHVDALEDLLKDVFKHKDSWPFSDPVSVEEVPDYLDVIDTPMDFKSIRNKLQSSHYTTDEEFMQDAALVFNNCYIYNKEDDPIARAGTRLQKYFSKKCAELEILGLPDIDEKKTEEAPKSKRAKLEN